MTEQPSISDELRANLEKVFALGFCDALTGRPVEDTDTIPNELADHLVLAAQESIAGAEQNIAQVFMEHPAKVYEEAYIAGYQTCIMLNGAVVPVNVHLN